MHQRPNAAPAPTPDAPPVPADTTQLPITRIADPATPDMTIGADLMDIDQLTHRLYVSNHNSHGVDGFDVSGPTPTYITNIGGLGGAEGVAVAPDISRVFAATPSGALAVIDATPGSATDNTVIASVQVAASGLDSIEYDPADEKVFVTAPGENTIGVVDIATNAVITKFTGLPSGLEQPRYNSADRILYVAVRDANMLLRFDLSSDALVRQTALPVECRPNGLFDGTGQFITNVPTSPICHQVAFDETNMMVYTIVGPRGVFRLPGLSDSQ